MTQTNDSQPLWPVYTFQVNLQTLQRYSWAQPSRTTLAGNETVTEADQQKNTRSTWLASMFPGCQFLAEKNAYQFVAKGFQAVYYKRTYVQGTPDDILFLVSS